MVRGPLGLVGETCALLVLAAAVGCGGNSKHSGDDDAGSGGSVASGGTGGSEPGATGGGAKPVSAAGLSINLSKPLASEVANVGTRSCPAGDSGAFTYMIGRPEPTETITSGTSSTLVTCVVTPSGMVVLSLAGIDANSGQKLSFDARATVRDKSGGSSAEITFFTPATSTLEVLDGFPDCTLGPVTTYKSGAILSDFECPLLGAVDDPSTGCRAMGTLAFEYCGTE